MNGDRRFGVRWDSSKLAPFKIGRVRHPKAVFARAAILVAMASCVCGAVRSQQATYRVAGIVLNDADGTPLGRTRVSLAVVQDRRQAESMITGADGRFEFRNVPAGKFSLEGAQRKFLVTTYQWHEGFSTAIITGAGLDTEHLELRMIPLGMIAGKVIDEAGEPVRNARVKLYMRNQQFGRDRVITHSYAQTDDEGKYEFPELIPAEYFVSAAARPWYAAHRGWVDENGVRKRDDTVAQELDVAYPTTFYGGATEAQDASPISIEKGARVAADIHLNAVPAMHVTMRVMKNPADGSESWPNLQKLEFDLAEPMNAEMAPGANPGEMELSGLVAGSYFVVEPNDSSATPSKGTQVELANEGQLIEPKAPTWSATVHVKVKTGRGEDLPQGLNLSIQNEKRRPLAFLALNGKNEVTFENVPPGKLALMVNVPSPPQYTVGRISQQGGAEVEGHDIVVEEGAAALEVNATLMAGVVSIEGVVKKDGRPVSGVMLALVPKEPRTHIERFRRDQSNLDGSFMVGGILPGKYTLIAVEDAWGFAWMKEGVLEKYLAKGQELTIGLMMNGTVVLPEAVEAQVR